MKVIGRPFKKGESGNPRGRPALPPDLRKQIAKDKVSFLKLLLRYLSLTHEQRHARVSGPEVTGAEEIIHGLINKASTGDGPATKIILDTAFGKIHDDDDSEFSDEDIRILNRVKELRDQEIKEARSLDQTSPSGAV